MDQIVRDLAEHTIDYLHKTNSTARVIISISGIPGSGKTTLASRVVQSINDISRTRYGQTVAISLAMDGFHLSRAELDKLSDPAEAHARRGAPFTFNSEGILGIMTKLREPVSSNSPIILAPSFDHAIKDPKDDDIRILPSNRVIIFEGNYLSLESDDWRHITDLFDELWFVHVDRETARRRLITRHVLAGIVQDAAEGARRADQNDLPNGDFIIANSRKPDRLIECREVLNNIQPEH